jgi:hypothetical protein
MPSATDVRGRSAAANVATNHTGSTQLQNPGTLATPTTARNTGSATLRAVEDYTNKYKGEQVELALFGGEYQEGTLTAYCSIEDVPHVELNGHILVPLQNVASLHCSSRCDAPEPDWPPRGLEELDRDDRPDDEDDEA